MACRSSARSVSPSSGPRTSCSRDFRPAGPSQLPSPRSTSYPASPPRILLRGECSNSAPMGAHLLSTGPSPTPRLAPEHPAVPALPPSRSPRLASPSDAPSIGHAYSVSLLARRLKSIVVAPSPESRLAISGVDRSWTEVIYQRNGCVAADPPVSHLHPGGHRPDRDGDINADRLHASLLIQFCGRRFRCLSKRHRLADCRDPVHCIMCKRAGHIGRLCPQNPRLSVRTGSARSRLGSAPPAQPLHARLRFPPPPSIAMSSMAPAMLHHIDPARRPRESRSVTIPSPAVDQTVFFLRSHVVTLSAADGVNATSPMAVGEP
ncbi:hypothetical protein D1007_05845 [Hordeum vulgare]|nr:hypothetical protein D1007_05845 [Hordeum vulgare]